MQNEKIQVVAAVFKYKNRVGFFRRATGKLAGFWEFPGGKVEAGESHEQALIREIFEELNVKVEVGQCLGITEGRSGERIIELKAYEINSFSGSFNLKEHDALVWHFKGHIQVEQVSPLDRFFLNSIWEFI